MQSLKYKNINIGDLLIFYSNPNDETDIEVRYIYDIDDFNVYFYRPLFGNNIESIDKFTIWSKHYYEIVKA